MQEKECELILDFDEKMKMMNSGKNPLRRSLMGYYGECIAAKEFRKKGFKVKKVGDLAGYDLLVNGIKIEVRTSEIKEERAFPKNILAWGWKLQSNDRNKKPKPIKYDYIVLVKLSEIWDNYELFMLSKSEVEEVALTAFPGYQTVARVIYFFKNSITEAQEHDSHAMITSKCVEFNKTPHKFLIDYDKLGN